MALRDIEPKEYIPVSEWIEKWSENSVLPEEINEKVIALGEENPFDFYPGSDALNTVLEEFGYVQVNMDNTYNYPNDLEQEVWYAVYDKVDDLNKDWLYSNNTLVVLCRHRGGDVRGNYGTLEFHFGGNLADNGFFDRVYSWETSVYFYNHASFHIHSRFCTGYSSEPTSELNNYLQENFDEEEFEIENDGYRWILKRKDNQSFVFNGWETTKVFFDYYY